MKKSKNLKDLTYYGKFKYVFKSPTLRFFAASIVSEILKIGYDYVFKHMEYADTVFTNTIFEEYRSDVIIKLDKTVLILEMNRHNYKYLRNNKLRYLGTVYDYYYKDNKNKYNGITVILVNINAFNDKQNPELFKIEYLFCNNKYQKLYSKNIEIKEFNLANGIKRWYNKFTESKLEKYLTYLIISRSNEEEISKYVKGDDVLMKADAIRKQIKTGVIPIPATSKEELEWEFEQIKEYAIEMAKEDGIASGMAKGMAKGRKKGRSYNVPYNVPISVDTIRRRYPIKLTYQEGVKTLIVDTKIWVF